MRQGDFPNYIEEGESVEMQRSILTLDEAEGDNQGGRDATGIIQRNSSKNKKLDSIWNILE